MKIACLAWGSLLWKTEPLRLASGWKEGGPHLPIEFARVGDKGELSTVVWEGCVLQATWWALMQENDLASAREMLRQREQIDPGRPEWLGSQPSARTYPCAEIIDRWRVAHGFDAVIWTALPPRYGDEEGRAPTIDEAVRYLDRLQGETRAHAEDYVRQIPATLATACRAAIESRLGLDASPASHALRITRPGSHPRPGSPSNAPVPALPAPFPPASPA